MQILTLLGAGKFLTKLVATLYRTVASMYSDVVNLVDILNNSELTVTINSVVSNIYVLIGIFMLFRIGVSLLNYLVDPDKINDKKVGGSQLVMHILISIVLFLSLRFVFVWTGNLQTHLLERDGVLYKIFNITKGDGTPNTGIENNDKELKAAVAALGDFSRFSNVCKNSTTYENAIHQLIISKIYKYYYDLPNANKIKQIPIKFKKSNATINFGPGVNTTLTNFTIQVVIDNNGKTSTKYLISFDGLLSLGDLKISDINQIKSVTYIYNCNYDLINTKKHLENAKNSEFESSAEGFEFSMNILTNFVSPREKMQTDIDNKTYAFLKDYNVTDTWAGQIEREKTYTKDNGEEGVYSMDWLMAIVVGIGIILLLIVIEVEVVIRNLKLVLLQAIAPIAAISYMNPDDKLLGKWAKEYIGVYFSLFLQLLAILLVPMLMNSLLVAVGSESSFFIKLIIIAASLIFMKEIPKMLSKLFGIEKAGSFGESLKMVKTGLGIGIGATAGAIAGSISGFGKGGSVSTVFGGLLGGTIRGTKGGAQGKVLDGAKTQIKRNNATKNVAAQGVNWFERQKGRTFVGNSEIQDMNRKIEKHKADAAKQGRMVTYAKNAKETALDVLQKGKADDLGGNAGQYRKKMDQFAQADAQRKNIVRSNFSSDSEYETALRRANDNYESIRSSIYGKNYAKNSDGSFDLIHKDDTGKEYIISSTGGRIDLDKGVKKYSFEDLAITETFNKSKDNKIVNLKEAARIDLINEFGIDVNNYESIKGASDIAEYEAARETAEANKIELSPEYQKLKIAQSLKDNSKQ